MSKPLVFNYKEYEDLRWAYKQLLEDNQKLMSDNRKLREENTNLKIHVRILEEDRRQNGTT